MKSHRGYPYWASLAVLAATMGFSGTARDQAPSEVVIRATAVPPPPSVIPFPAGGRAPKGEILSVNSRYLLRDGVPWFPVMGEFQYSRYPEAEWEDEILKMKAGGVQIISTYVFWIHHEEIEGQFDWTGQRNLRRFVQLCAKHGLYVWVRIGPWDHGECRNGGFPDWLIKQCPTRQIDPVYLGYVKRFYAQIGLQLKGLFWKDGGPTIGIQLENEYSARGPGKGADYILALRQLALEAGLDAPFYTITGWDDAVIPSSGVLPVFGGYPDGFWKRTAAALPPNVNYFFTLIRCDENVTDDLRSSRPDIDALDAHYPYLTAEMGGGMELSYHRRPLVDADDIAAMEVAKLGSGVSLYGYYMFHGGTNPDGKLTTLQESQITGYPNDLPVKSYDFQAPLGEFGQMHASFRVLKAFHLFLADFGSSLAPMTPYFPDKMPEGKTDTETPRVAARLQHDHGFLFINNYQRLYPLPPRKHFQVRLKLATGAMEIPKEPVDIPSGAYTIWPVNLNLGATILRYSTAQPLCEVDDPKTFVFFAWPGIEPGFAIDEKPGVSVDAPDARITRASGVAYVSDVKPGTGVAVHVRAQGGGDIQIVVLSREQALNAWKAKLAGRERLIVSPAELFFDRDRIHLLSSDPSLLKASFFPAWDRAPSGFLDDGSDGVFHRYAVAVKTADTNVTARVEMVQEADDPPPAKIGNEVAMVPDESAFEKAARWKIRVPHTDASDVHEVFLNIRYEGDIARIYAGGRLLTDNFYNGSTWEIGLSRISPEELARGLELRISPLRRDTAIYLPPGASPAFAANGEAVKLDDVRLIPEYEVVRDLSK
ncbi:MAG TPA: beta-galactosidase [Candidatus Acidoferrales bacterium]|nr:beta-galactosidase [Candidatus Acidoferrales bacterium]